MKCFLSFFYEVYSLIFRFVVYKFVINIEIVEDKILDVWVGINNRLV